MSTIVTTSPPIIKWAGGKTQLLPELVPRLPKSYHAYYEPFFGGGSLFFHIAPARAVINDSNLQLINMYQWIRQAPDTIIKNLSAWQKTYNSYVSNVAKSAYYYKKRERFNTYLSQARCSNISAALLIFLNKAGFNGLYRLNQDGLYNVPSGHKRRLSTYRLEHILAASYMLQHASILYGDFEEACKTAREGDFVFFDSPYYGTFDQYLASGFDEESHLRLARLFKALTKRHVYCLETNNDCAFIRNLYATALVESIPVKRMINCDGKHRTGREVIIRNYDDGGNFLLSQGE